MNHASNTESVLKQEPQAHQQQPLTTTSISTEPKAPYVLRPHKSGDMELITRMHGELFAKEYGWDNSFEALVREITTNFEKSHNPEKERSWIAEKDGEVVGCVIVVRLSDEVAKVRVLYVDASTRGLGIGQKLVEECVKFARAKGYKTLTLWTVDILVSARKIYQAAGFKLMKEEQQHLFGKDLVGQTWELEL